jgi:Polyketide cyclase / dehydrase and lipid transport
VVGVALRPPEALVLWSDLERWPAFVEGFERVVERDARWPEEGAVVVWESIPQGRGRITERVVERDPDRWLRSEVLEEPLGGGSARLSGRQSLTLVPFDAGEGDAPAGSRAELALEYELAGRSGFFEWLTDVVFVRRALAASLERTLARFASEAAIEARAEAESAR